MQRPAPFGLPDHARLLVSCIGDYDTGGGLFSWDGRALERLDTLSTTGLATDGLRLHRALRTRADAEAPGERLVYDSRGIVAYHRIDDLRDAHDITLDGGFLVAVSSNTNSVLWIAPDGSVARAWRAPGSGDCWHLNSVLVHQGRLVLAAFGRFPPPPRGWTLAKGRPTGVVFDLETGSDLLSGLVSPHHPRWFDDGWLVCNSGLSDVSRYAADGSLLHAVDLGGFTRGVAVTASAVFVGVSGNRFMTGSCAPARLAVLDRATLAPLASIPVPCREVYDLLVVPAELVEAVRIGFRTNPTRVAEQDQHQLFRDAGVQPARLWATGDPLPPEACRVRLEADFPERVAQNDELRVDCRLENHGGAILVSAPPNPVLLSYKWLDPATGRLLPECVSLRSSLPRSLAPRARLAAALTVATPARPGTWLLRVTLVQEGVCWFDDVAPTNGVERLVGVVAGPLPTKASGGPS